MVIIGIGNEVDRDELEAITKATSAGGVFIAPDPAKIAEIFLEAISSRSGAAADGTATGPRWAGSRRLIWPCRPSAVLRRSIG